MTLPLKRNDQGTAIVELQNILTLKGYPVAPDGVFGSKTYRAVRAFQSQNLDPRGEPLVVNGKVGPLTW